MKIYSIREYAEKFPQAGKTVTPSTIYRRCKGNLLPSGHRVKKVDGHLLIIISESCMNCFHFRQSSVFDNTGRCIKIDPPFNVLKKMWCSDYISA